MKNIFIINHHSRAMYYGVGTYMQQLISAIQSLSVRITVVTLSDGLSDLEIREKDDIRYIFIPMPIAERYTYFFSKKEDERFFRNIYYMLLPYIPEKEELIFHFNFLELGKLACLLKAHFQCKIVVTMHYSHWGFKLLGDYEKLNSILKGGSGEDIQEKEIREFFLMEQTFYKDIADYIIAIAQHSYDELLHLYGIPSSKVVLISNGLKDKYRKVDVDEKRKLRKLFHLMDDEKLLLFVGRVTPVKGLSYLIQAFKEVLKVRKDVRLMIIGESSEVDLAVYQKMTFPFYSKISFTGFIPQEKLVDIYSVADLGIVPSEYEPFGYVAIEMLMYGVPVIVNETTGLKEIIQDGVNGSYFHIQKGNGAESIAELSMKIIELLDDPDKRARYIQVGRESFCRQYELEVFTRCIKEFYLQIK